MSYSYIEQLSRDIDFFVFGRHFNLHFASAGGRLPRLIEENDLINEETFEVVNGDNSDYSRYEYAINPNLPEIIGFQSESINYQNYIIDFVRYAQKGFFSFDKTDINNLKDMHYHLVAYPKKYSDMADANMHWEKLVPSRLNANVIFDFENPFLSSILVNELLNSRLNL